MTFSRATFFDFCQRFAGFGGALGFSAGFAGLGFSWGSPKPRAIPFGLSWASTGAAMPLFPLPNPLPNWYPIFCKSLRPIPLVCLSKAPILEIVGSSPAPPLEVDAFAVFASFRRLSAAFKMDWPKEVGTPKLPKPPLGSDASSFGSAPKPRPPPPKPRPAPWCPPSSSSSPSSSESTFAPPDTKPTGLVYLLLVEAPPLLPLSGPRAS